MGHHTRPLLLPLLVSLAAAGPALAQPRFELHVRLHGAGDDQQVVIKAPKLGVTQLVAEPDDTRQLFVAKLGVPSQAPCVVPLDVAATSGTSEDLLHLQLLRPMLTSPVEASFAGESPAAATRQQLIVWQDQLSAAVADDALPDEQGVLRAYFRGRRSFRYWHGVNPAHENTIRSARLWFDAAYQLAKIGDRPYRMDRAAVRAVRALAEEARGDPRFEQAYQRLFRMGYSDQIVSDADALLFRHVGAIEQLRRGRRFAEALALNSCMLEALRSLPPEKQRAVTETQRFSEELLTRNEQYLRTLVGASDQPGSG